MKNQGIIFFILLLAIASCKKTMHEESKANDQWTYRYTNYDSAGTVTGVADRNFTAIGYNLETSTEIDEWVRIRENGTDYTVFPCDNYHLRDGALYRIIDTSVISLPGTFLVYPGTIGYTFTHYHNSELVCSTTIGATSDTLTVPYGQFLNLYKYDITYTGSPTHHLWFNDSVWFVKYNIYDSCVVGSYLSQSIELVNYTAN